MESLDNQGRQVLVSPRAYFEGAEEEGADPWVICVVDGEFVGWPAFEQYSTLLVDPVALELFGREAFTKGNLLPYPLRSSLVPIIACTWDNL